MRTSCGGSVAPPRAAGGPQPAGRWVILLLAAALLLAGALTAQAAPPRLATPKQIAAATIQLKKLRVAAPLSERGYSREKFPHWDSTGYGCDTRDDILKRDAIRVRVGGECRIIGGTWREPYGGTTTHDPHSLDIDHLVPLANAWRSGAKRWTTKRRETYANDPRVLLAVDAGLNRSKGDDGPEQWLPPRVAFRVTYAVRWVGVKARYRLSVTRVEKSALEGLLTR